MGISREDYEALKGKPLASANSPMALCGVTVCAPQLFVFILSLSP